MPRAFIRSALFNLLFYCLTAVACVVCLPTLVLPRRFFMGVVHAFVHTAYFLERTVLGLKMEVRGLENLPKDGSYIIAAKHQSAYETLKLHILFKDPAVILKKELLSIPLWGMYLKKSDPIAIDRSNPDSAISSIQEGAQRVKEQGRPIVIFPQGTRVSVHCKASEKPYKVGVARIQDATDLPIIPVAMNSGLYWPRNSWFKSPGTVIFSILPAIEAGKERSVLIKELEEEIEDESLSLLNEAREKQAEKSMNAFTAAKTLVFLVTILFGIYSFMWFKVADQTRNEYSALMRDITGSTGPFQEPKISGYPGKIKLYVEKEHLRSDKVSVQVNALSGKGWPFPYAPIHVHADSLQIQYFEWPESVTFDSFNATLSLAHNNILNIHTADLNQKEFNVNAAGHLDLSQKPTPRIHLDVALNEYTAFLKQLSVQKIIEPQAALFLTAGLSAFQQDDGSVVMPIRQKKQTLFIGPLPIMTFDPVLERDEDLDTVLHPVP